jgi:hypothetical protein
MPADRQRRRRPTAFEVSFPGETQVADRIITEVPVPERLYRLPRTLIVEEMVLRNVKKGDEARDAVLLEDFTFFDKHKRMVQLPCEYTEDDIFGAGKAYLEEYGTIDICIGPIHQYSIERGGRHG